MSQPSLFFVTAFFSFIALPFLVSAQTGTLCNGYASGQTPPAGYGAAWNTLTSARELLLSATCSTSSVSLKVGIGNASHYVYKQGYVYTAGAWQPKTFTGTFVADSVDWLSGTGSHTYSNPPSDATFWVGYVCQWTGSVWKCGCRDAACATPYWQLQAVQYPGGTTGGTTGGTSGGSGRSFGSGTIKPPSPPQSYTPPSGGIRVSNSAELRNALAGGTARDIILENGTYDNAGPFAPAAAHRLWAASLGGATLTAGIYFNRGAGPEVHGIRFNVSDRSKVRNDRRDGAVLFTDGGAHGLKVTDSWFNGNGRIGGGVDVKAINGGVEMRRLVVTNMMSVGVRADDHPARTATKDRIFITDVDISNIKHSSADCCAGQVEFGIYAGTTMTVERAHIRNVDWSGIVPLVKCYDCVFRDIDIDATKSSAFYFEHYTHDSVLERFHIGPDVDQGINFESGGSLYNDGVGPNNVVQDGIIESSRIGVNVPYCNEKVTVQRVKFVGQCGAAIAHSAAATNRVCEGADYGPTNKFLNNDYSGIKPGADQITPKHPNGISC